MATGLAAISSSSSSSFHPLFKSSSLFDSSRTSIEGTSCRMTVRSRRSLNSRSYPGTILTVRSAATKPAKAPAEEDWKTKRKVLRRKRAHPPGAINVQIYRQECGLCVFRDLRWNGREPRLLKKADAKIIVACTNGGTIRPSHNLPEGQQSRSLIAAYLLVLNGYANVYHLEGGLYTWFKEGFPTSTKE